jgi:hypothetical protein
VLFGPLATESCKLDFFLNSDPLAYNKKTYACNVYHKKELNQAKVERDIALSDKHGMTLGERVQLAFLEL